MIALSIVLYNDSKGEIDVLAKSILKSQKIKTLYLVDNSQHTDRGEGVVWKHFQIEIKRYCYLEKCANK